MDSLDLGSAMSLINLILGLLSFSWIAWRFHKVLETPVDDLVKLLGQEVPVAPIATLLDITTSSVAVHWKPVDQRSSAVKHLVKVNGGSVGEISNNSHAVNIVNLQPGHAYTIRIIAINASGFKASSDAIRVRTPLLPSNEGDDLLNIPDTMQPPAPSIVVYKAFGESQNNSATAPQMAREHSGSISQTKRGSLVRRTSPATYGDTAIAPSEIGIIHGEHPNTLTDFTSKLESIRREIEDSEKVDDEEEHEFQSIQLTLTERRESLRQQLKGRDDESNDLKKSVTSLERQNTAAQTRKTKLEKLLNQKLNERSKFYDEVKRWLREASDFQREVKDLAIQKEAFLESAQDQAECLGKEQEEDNQATRAIEEGIREAGTRVKELEEEKKILDEPYIEAGLSERQRKSIQEESEWSDRLQHLQSRYQAAWSAYTQAQQLYQQTQQRLDFLSTRHNNQVSNVNHYIAESQMMSIDNLPNLTNGGSRNSAVLPELSRPQSLSNRVAPSASSGFQAASPFFSHVNLISNTNSSNAVGGISDADAEILTGGALVSPTAGALLPTGLLGDDGEDVIRQAPYLPGLGAAPESEGGDVGDDSRQDMTSPLSLDSQSPSLISSPHGSVSNFHHHKVSESRIDADRMSVRSASSSSRVAPTRRFADVFGFPRSRATSNDGFPLGSLKRYQSRSMPQQEEDGAFSSSSTSGIQRRGGSSGGLFGSVTQAFGRIGGPSTKVVEEHDTTLMGPSAERGVHNGIFGSKASPWARTSSPRPASTYSTYSTENALPHPSTDNHPFGWSTNDATTQHVGTRNPSVSNPWPTFSSRRQSVQHDSTTSLVHNISQLDADSQELPEVETSPPQAPIGTKPAKTKHNSPQKQLNPTALDFRSMLSRDKKGERSRKSDKLLAGEEENSNLTDNSSPPESRKSREKRFSSAAESVDEPFEDHIADSPVKSNEKESFVRKITRKGSSTRFGGFSSGLFSRKGVQSTEDADEDGVNSALGRSLESVASNQQSPGDKRGLLSSFKRRGKKGTETPSISEASLASETGDETDERASVDVDE